MTKDEGRMTKAWFSAMAALCCCCSSLSLVAAEPVVRLESPLEYQVFQRQTRLAGTVLLAGKVEGRLEYRWVGKPLVGALAADWRAVVVDATTHGFHSEISTPAGGWYRLELRVDGAAAGAVEHVGVGE